MAERFQHLPGILLNYPSSCPEFGLSPMNEQSPFCSFWSINSRAPEFRTITTEYEHPCREQGRVSHV